MKKLLLAFFAIPIFAFGDTNNFNILDKSFSPVTYGTSTQVWTSNGNGSSPTWQSPSSATLPFYVATSYGMKCDGVTDDTTAFNNLILTVYAGHGGIIFIPVGTCLITGQITFPNNGIPVVSWEPYGRQPNIRITGTGDVRNGQSQIPGNGFGGSVLNMTFAGSAAKMQTFGLGSLELDHLTFTDTSQGSTPFFLTTGTTVNIHDNSFIGTKSGNLCDQDALLIGGYIDGAPLNSTNSSYQGYDSSIINNYFNHIRRAVYAKTFVASLYVSNNFVGPASGSNLVGGAPFEFDGTEYGNNTVDNHIIDNRCEITGYYYCAKFLASQNNYIAGMDVEDAQNSYNTAVYYFDATSSNNMVFINAAPDSGGITTLTHVIDLTVSQDSPLGSNFIFDSTQSAPTTISAGSVRINNLSTLRDFTMLPQHIAATSGSNYPAGTFIQNGVYWTGTASANDQWSIYSNIGTGANPTSYLTFAHSGTSGTSAVYIPLRIIFGSAAETSIDADGNVSIGSGTVYIGGSGVYTDNVSARNAGDSLIMEGRATAASGNPSAWIQAAAGLNATDVAVQFGAIDGNPVEILKNGDVLLAGNIVPGGEASSIISGDCGATTNGSVSGTNQSGVINIGSASTTLCKVTFGTPFTAAPKSCTFSPASAGAAAVVVGTYISAIAITYFSLSGAALASTAWNYQCF